MNQSRLLQRFRNFQSSRKQKDATNSSKSSPATVPASPKRSLLEKPHPRVIPLSDNAVAAKTLAGFFLVVPDWNVDVAIGIIRDGIIEPWTNAVFLSLFEQGDQVVNVGANFGYYSALAAQWVGPEGVVHAIEANPAVFPYLIKSLYWSGFSHIIQAYNCAATSPESHQQTLKFAYDPQFMGGGNLFSRAREFRTQQDCLWSAENMPTILDPQRRFIPRGLFHEVETEGRTLDSLISTPCKAMLIDAEGSESFVIAGAHQLIANSPRLSIIMEWDPGTYGAFPERRPVIDRMWDFLLNEQGFTPLRICPENYPGIGKMPGLDPLSRETLFQVPHSDILLTRTS